MQERENNSTEIIKVFDNSIYEIRDEGIPGISEKANRTVERIRAGDVQIALKNPLYHVPSLTGFELGEYQGRTDLYLPTILIDPGSFMSDKKEYIKADLVRSISLTDQAPYNGFEERMHEAYSRALADQGQYLTEKNIQGKVFYDPRVRKTQGEIETLLRTLLGDARYYSDVGYSDWQAAVRKYRDSGLDVDATPFLDILENAEDQFIVMRRVFVPMNHRTAMNTFGKEYLFKWTADRRAEATAYSLMGASLHAMGAPPPRM